MMIDNFMDRYFDVAETYPRNVAGDILPVGTLWDCIASPFLDGFINYVTIKKAFLTCEYESFNSEFDMSVDHYKEGNRFVWTETQCKSKSEIFDVLIRKNATAHTKILSLCDSVAILATVENSPMLWYFFYYCASSSNSMIGRFETSDSDKDVILSFENYVKSIIHIGDDADNPDADIEPRELPLSFFRGWISY